MDVTWATEESGLLLGVSIKTINFRDGMVAERNFDSYEADDGMVHRV